MKSGAPAGSAPERKSADESDALQTLREIPRKVKPGRESAEVEVSLAIVDKKEIDRMGGTSLQEALRKRVFGR